jgi:hypothetical protein
MDEGYLDLGAIADDFLAARALAEAYKRLCAAARASPPRSV